MSVRHGASASYETMRQGCEVRPTELSQGAEYFAYDFKFIRAWTPSSGNAYFLKTPQSRSGKPLPVRKYL
jgi:hypothetical protein